jgi:5-methylcytosine-specific restriction endonuclease McrA
MSSTKPLKRIRIKFKGFDEQWQLARAEWFELNSPDYDGDYYQCGLCPYAVHKDETTLDHIEPKSTHPHLKYVLSNLQPAHEVCNNRKGSMSMEWYRDAYPELMREPVPA